MALLIMTAAAVLIPAAGVGLVSLYLDAIDKAADDIAENDRAASLAEFFPVHNNVDNL